MYSHQSQGRTERHKKKTDLLDTGRVLDTVLEACIANWMNDTIEFAKTSRGASGHSSQLFSHKSYEQRTVPAVRPLSIMFSDALQLK